MLLLAVGRRRKHDRPLEQRLDHREDLADLAIGIEIGRHRPADEQPVTELADDRGDCPGVDRGIDAPGRLGALKGRGKLLLEGAVEIGLKRGNGRIAGGFGPDLEAKPGLAGIGLFEVLLAKGMEGSEEIAAGGAKRGEFLAQAEAVAFAEAGDQGILGGEIAIEIARTSCRPRRRRPASSRGESRCGKNCARPHPKSAPGGRRRIRRRFWI